jgi:hypothetical protein
LTFPTKLERQHDMADETTTATGAHKSPSRTGGARKTRSRKAAKKAARKAAKEKANEKAVGTTASTSSTAAPAAVLHTEGAPEGVHGTGSAAGNQAFAAIGGPVKGPDETKGEERKAQRRMPVGLRTHNAPKASPAGKSWQHFLHRGIELLRIATGHAKSPAFQQWEDELLRTVGRGGKSAKKKSKKQSAK